MAKLSREINPTELRKFAMLMAVFLAGIGAVMSLNGASAWPFVLPFSMVFFLLGLVRPTSLSGMYRYWMKFAEFSSRIVTGMILLAFFFLIVTPTGIVGRLLGKRFLPGGPDASLDTYWIEKQGRDGSMDTFERQF